jgi:hypothetical protein
MKPLGKRMGSPPIVSMPVVVFFIALDMKPILLSPRISRDSNASAHAHHVLKALT